MFLLFLYLFIAIFFSFMCSVLEAVVLSIPQSYISIRIEEGSSLAKDLKRLQRDIDQPLSAILTLNTFAHTLGAAGVGAQAQLIWGEEYLSLISAVLTILILILSEIIPKTIGASYWKELAPAALKTLRGLIFILYPFVKISQVLTNWLKKSKVESIFTRSDLQKMAEVIKKEGSIQQGESRIIQNLMRFNQIQVKKIMTPRTVVLAEEQNTTIAEIRPRINNIPFSRIPVYETNIDEITGFVLKDDLLKEMAEDQEKTALKDIAREIYVVHSSINALAALDELIQHKAHISLVVDEYGGTEGVITIEDVIESLLGLEIIDETDRVRDMQKVAKQRWLERRRRIGLSDKDV